MEKIIVTCAVTGGGDTVGKHPAIPVTPEQIARAAVDAGEAGAAVAHIHVRDPDSGEPSMALHLYEEVVERIRASGSGILINLTAGAGGRYIPDETNPGRGAPGTTLSTPRERMAHVTQLRPDLCSLDMGSMNFARFAFLNPPDHLREMADLARSAGAKPELECFEPGHIRFARRLVEEGHIEQPPHFQICLGIPWTAPANLETVIYMRNQLPVGATWSGFGIGASEFPMVAGAALLGGHVRVGLEDNLYLERGVQAPDNAALVEKAVRILRELGFDSASPADTRGILSVGGGR